MPISIFEAGFALYPTFLSLNPIAMAHMVIPVDHERSRDPNLGVVQIVDKTLTLKTKGKLNYLEYVTSGLRSIIDVVLDKAVLQLSLVWYSHSEFQNVRKTQ